MFRSLNFLSVAILALITVTPTLQERVLFCDFDANNCGYTSNLKVGGQDDPIQVDLTNKLEIKSLVFTDYTSISEVTSVGFPCDLTKQQFCDKDLACTTTNSSLGKCEKGRFLFVKNDNTKQTEKFTIELPAEKIPEIGMYELSFKFFAECITEAGKACAENHDLVTVGISGDRIAQTKAIFVGDKFKTPGWHSEVLPFSTTKRNQIVTLKIDNDIKDKEAMTYVYGFDQLSIDSVEPPTQAPTTEAPTTTTTPPTTAPTSTAPVVTVTQTVTVAPGNGTTTPPTTTATTTTTTTQKPTTTTTNSSSGPKSIPIFLAAILLSISAAMVTFVF